MGLFFTNPQKKVLIVLNDMGFNEGVVTQDMPVSLIHKHLLEMIKVARNMPEVLFIIRPHDDENLWDYILEKELKENKNVTVDRAKPLGEVFKRTDLVIGYISTALLEALICRIPVISIEIADEDYPALPFWEHGLSKKITDFAQLEGAVRGLI